jgi:hypothetical protein
MFQFFFAEGLTAFSDFAAARAAGDGAGVLVPYCSYYMVKHGYKLFE